MEPESYVEWVPGSGFACYPNEFALFLVVGHDVPIIFDDWVAKPIGGASVWSSRIVSRDIVEARERLGIAR